MKKKIYKPTIKEMTDWIRTYGDKQTLKKVGLKPIPSKNR
jgi:hypothetical protein